MGFYDYELKCKTWHLIGVMPLSNVSVDEEICSLTDYLNHCGYLLCGQEKKKMNFVKLCFKGNSSDVKLTNSGHYIFKREPMIFLEMF